MLYSSTTFKYDFDYQPDDVYWCTADVGWITGHTYVTYGPLNNGATSVIVREVHFKQTWALRMSMSSLPTVLRYKLLHFSRHWFKHLDMTAMLINLWPLMIAAEAWCFTQQDVKSDPLECSCHHQTLVYSVKTDILWYFLTVVILFHPVCWGFSWTWFIVKT